MHHLDHRKYGSVICIDFVCGSSIEDGRAMKKSTPSVAERIRSKERMVSPGSSESGHGPGASTVETRSPGRREYAGLLAEPRDSEARLGGADTSCMGEAE